MTLPVEYQTTAAIVIGFGLDAVLGDPQNPYHPVRLMGLVISGLVSIGDKLNPKSNRVKFILGTLITLITVLLFYFCTRLFLAVLYNIHVFAGLIAESLLCYLILAPKSLYTESMGIYKLLSRNDLAGARKRLSFIVGRDTETLSEEGVVQATVETVSENLSDGVVAPLLFMLIGGAPLGMAYKAINTLDSMVGYRNERFAYLGRFAARLDDLANLLPARLSALLMILASAILRMDWRGAIRVYRRDRYKHFSPNSAHTEAVCAGALGIQLGGRSSYKGKIVEKPTIGDKKRNLVIKDIQDSAVLMYGASILALLLGILLTALLGGWFHVSI